LLTPYNKIKFIILTHAHICTHVGTLNPKYFKLNYKNFKVYTTRKCQITVDEILSLSKILLLRNFIDKFNSSLITNKLTNKKIYHQIIRKNNKWINIKI